SRMRRALIVLAAVVTACGPSAAAPPAAAPSPTRAQATQAAQVTTAPAAAPPTPAPTAVPTTPPPVGTPTVSAEVIARNLDTPWAIDFAPDGRVFVSERPGRIRVLRDGQLLPEPWATLDVAEVGEGGLMGIALDPQFAQTRFLYASYTTRAGGGIQNKVVRLRDDPATNKGALDKTLLESIPAASNHDGSRVKFGPDGKLYVTMGDAEQPQQAQNRATLNGKILRLNSDGTIPSDNPFPDSAVYSYGHRNPQGLAWQPGTGRLYATEHGPSGVPCCQDELNFVEPGKNYGWPTITGDATREGMVSPIRQSGATATWAPSGATFITKGPWAGSLLFAGLRGAALYKVGLDPGDPRKVTSFEALFERQYGRLRDIAEAPDGTLYLLTSNQDGRGQPTAEDDRIIRVTVK
ncbi:MAG TPA: PQQ-dependent sugar dehydrogenase, partial [Chloroflexota bacterium]|nr:PQQ-dependent sugar dehydrogenase [Chloroflexota bacterium]